MIMTSNWQMIISMNTTQSRSYNMSRIRCRDTKPEVLVRKYLFSQGFRYRKNDAKMPGKPDVVLPRYRTVVFVNGCFWHRHDCRYFVWPKNNADFWRLKIESNVERDIRNYQLLREMGWRVIIVWECELKPDKRSVTLDQLKQLISSP